MKFISLTLGLLIVLTITGYSTVGYQEKISSLKTEKAQLESKLEDINQIGILYYSYNDKKRFVQEETGIRSLPISWLQPIRSIPSNSVIEVIDSGMYKDDLLWLYVSVPVYDTPVNNKGWVPESKTLPLTTDHIKLVQSDVTLKAETPIYHVEQFNDIASSKPVLTSHELKGRIEKRQGFFIYMMSPGGSNYWVEEKYIIYPTID